MATKRIEKWDNLKFFLILFVVVGHFCEYFIGNNAVARDIFVFIYSFHMPLFIFVSGLFSKKNIDEKRYEKMFSFVIVFFLINILLFVSKSFFLKGFNFSADIFNMAGVPWYAFAIFAFSLITVFLKKFSPLFVLTSSIILACFAGYNQNISTFLSLSRIIVYYPFFYLGYFLREEDIIKFVSKKYIKILSVVIIIALGIVVFNVPNIHFLTPLLTSSGSYFEFLDNVQFGGLCRLAYYAIVPIICVAVISLVPEKIPTGIIAKFGSRSLQVYILHYPIIYILTSEKLNILFFRKDYEHPVFTIFVAGIVLTLVLSLKVFSEPIFKIINPKKRKD